MNIEINLKKIAFWFMIIISGPFTLFHSWTAVISIKLYRKYIKIPPHKKVSIEYESGEDESDAGVAAF